MIFQNLIVDLNLPLSIIVDQKFRVPSYRSIASDYLPKLHQQITKRLKHACSSTDFLSLTFDGWTDRLMRAFYAVTMHCIDRMGQLNAHLLTFNSLSVENDKDRNKHNISYNINNGPHSFAYS
ncbi:unnamed protein product [Rotaria magnacalcarata]|uniref:Uncharacterized protein n=1 Tax=Rotaria magnacalcarata TaxID=392030 RepID=A0A820NBE0_9BILA|nr:unnamed protein product [Rotaria magnacalcarata]CAF4385456.1 unnamed protein product [Rotaria magnacalcarata]CAF5046187.1 unnamed protein product [Rotaria magnacalcarata]